MSKQLIIAGFHRSGTSMLAQELHLAGLCVGDRLMDANISNADGHFEDMDIYQFHEKLLRYNQENWQYSDTKELLVPKKYKFEMKRLVDYRDKKYKEWGFKDPRTSLFLPAWQENLSQAYTVVIYRHYSETSRSLLHRASKDLLNNPNPDTLRFWQDATLSYRMWLAYNTKLITYVQANPKTTLVISHEAVLQGYPIVQTLKEHFDFDLDTTAPSGIKPTLVSSDERDVPLPNATLLAQLDLCWEMLQGLSIAPAKEKQREIKITHRDDTLGSLRQNIKNISNNEASSDRISTLLNQLSDENLSLEDKIKIIQENMNYFFLRLQEKKLYKAIEKLLKNHQGNTELLKLQSNVYRRAKLKDKTIQSDMMLLATAPHIAPWQYARIAESYLLFDDLDKVELFLDKALKGNPNNPHFYLLKSDFYQKQFKYTKALESLELCIQKSSTNPNSQLNSMIKRCEIFYTLYQNDRLTNEIERIRTLAKTLENAPIWIEKRLSSFEIKKIKDIDLKADWKHKVLEVFKRYDFNILLNYFLQSIEDPLMREDFICRMNEKLDLFNLK